MNSADMAAKGRAASSVVAGQPFPPARRISEDEILAIRVLHSQGLNQREIGERLGFSDETARRYLTGERAHDYPHLRPPEAPESSSAPATPGESAHTPS
jgi:hypothetical protein